MREVPLINGEYYHIFNRGVDKRSIFIDDGDRERFLRGLRVINDVDRPKNLPLSKDLPITNHYVMIASYCLMTNHFHLLLKQVANNGISEFLQRFLGGYVKYFNLRHGRTGRLFGDAFQNVHVNSDEQLLTSLRYIHQNPLDIIPDATDQTTHNQFLDYYPWSSHLHYRQKKMDPVINDDFVTNLIGSQYQLLWNS